MSEYMEILLHDSENGFEVTDDQKALWCVHKIAEAQREAAALLKHYDEQAKKVNDQLQATTEFFQAKLYPYFTTLPLKETKTQKSYALPGAKLVLKKQGPTYTRDEDALLAFLKASGRTDCIKTIPATEKPAWDKYKPFTTVYNGTLIDTETGEVVAGITVTQNPDRFEVKIEGV